MVQPLHIGNALRLILEPPAGATRWKVLRKGSNTFTGHDDAGALLVSDGDETVLVDTVALQNTVMQFYCVFYTTDGASWTPSNVANGTPDATYVDHTTDVLSHMRERLEAGLKVECERGNFRTDLGYIQVYTAPPSLEQNLRFPLVTIHLEDESSGDRALGESIQADDFDRVGFDWAESDGWLANVKLVIIGWSLNSDERIELRKALRRIIVGNFPVFDSLGWILPSLTQSDLDAVNGEYPSPLYQTMNNFSCTAPVRVSGSVDAISDVISRSING